VYRFYSLEEKKTYSILPLFVSYYERHINTVIEDILRGYFIEKLSAEKMAEDPSPWTIRRLIRKFKGMFDKLCYAMERYLILNDIEHQPSFNKFRSSSDKLEFLLKKAELIEENKDLIYLYGSLSYILYAATIQNTEF
jgi:hypothetical protein